VANIKSQIKRIRTNNKAQDRNKAYRSALRQQTKSQRWPSWPTKLAFVNFLDTSKA